jgi:hypothetical protein
MDGDYIGLVSNIQQIFKDFRSAWYLGCTTFCYLMIQILRGKAGFQIPWVTTKIDGLNKEVKTGIVIGVFVLIGFLGAFAQKPLHFTTILDGLLGGLALGVGTVGTRNVVKQGIDLAKQQIRAPAPPEPPLPEKPQDKASEEK